MLPQIISQSTNYELLRSVLYSPKAYLKLFCIKEHHRIQDVSFYNIGLHSAGKSRSRRRAQHQCTGTQGASVNLQEVQIVNFLCFWYYPLFMLSTYLHLAVPNWHFTISGDPRNRESSPHLCDALQRLQSYYPVFITNSDNFLCVSDFETPYTYYP